MDPLRIWDGEPVEATRARIPSAALVHFPKVRTNADATGASPWHTISVADPSGTLPGVESGTVAVIYDDLAALFDSADALTNGVALTNRANERAADYYREARQARLQRVYTGAQGLLGLRPGALIKATSWEEVGAGIKTGVLRRPGLIDARLGLASGHGGAGTDGLDGWDGLDGSTEYPYDDAEPPGTYPDYVGEPYGDNYVNFYYQIQTYLSFLIQLITGAGGSADYHFYRQAGTSPLNTFYMAGYLGGPQATGASVALIPDADKLYAIPFIVPKTITVDRLAVYILTGGPSGSRCRLGIYEATSSSNLYPSGRVIDGGELTIETTQVLVTLTISQTLSAGKLYYVVGLFNTTFVSGPGEILSLDPNAAQIGVLGTNSTTGFGKHRSGWQVGQAYGALPATYPASGTAIVDGPLMGFRLSG